MKWLDVTLIAVLILSVLPLQSIEGSATALAPQDDEGVEAEGAEAPAANDPDSEFERMEEILRQEEDMVQGSFAYDAGRRRDPFISLLARPDRPDDLNRAADCPTGCLIDEITLTGIFVMPDGPVAQILSPDQDKSYLIRVGDEFHDGDVIEISADSVRFRQMVNDFQEMKPFREVTKKLNP